MDDLIRQAIAERRIVSFRYNGQRRIGEPHLLGLAQGRARLLVYQTEGSSQNGPYPRWRQCDLSDIARFILTSRTFESARLNAAGSLKDWDEVWAIVQD